MDVAVLDLRDAVGMAPDQAVVATRFHLVRVRLGGEGAELKKYIYITSLGYGCGIRITLFFSKKISKQYFTLQLN